MKFLDLPSWAGDGAVISECKCQRPSPGERSHGVPAAPYLASYLLSDFLYVARNAQDHSDFLPYRSLPLRPLFRHMAFLVFFELAKLMFAFSHGAIWKLPW